MEDLNFDQEISTILETTFQQALLISAGAHTPEQLRLMIVSTNLESLAKTFLIADNQPDTISLDLKKVALGLLGTADWIKDGLDGMGD